MSGAREGRFAAADAQTRASLERLCCRLAERTGTQAGDWFPVFKARQGMKVAFDVLAKRACPAVGGTESGAVVGTSGSQALRREVVTQLFTCCTAVDPIVAAGLAPVYGDISARTLALDASLLPVGERTAAVVLQHTFGIMDAEADARLREVAHAAGAIVMEDCAHCAGRISRDAQGAPVADVSVHSFGVEKMLPTHFGGAVWVNPRMADAPLRDEMRARLASLPLVAPALARAARHYLNQVRVLNHLPHGLSHALRERLSAVGLFEPAIASVELAGGLASEPALPSRWVADQAHCALAAASADEDVRRAAVAAYGEALADVPSSPREGGAWVCAGGLDPALPLLRLGVFVPGEGKADEALARLRATGFYVVPWYRPLLFPGVSDEAAFGLPRGIDAVLARLPVTRACSVGAVCLPCDLSPERAREALAVALSL